ncbi:MAG: hypothetical protein ACRD29_13335 [Acidimicrobiales bacterium]
MVVGFVLDDPPPPPPADDRATELWSSCLDARALIGLTFVYVMLEDPQRRADAAAWLDDPATDVPPNGRFLDSNGELLPYEVLRGTEALRWALTWVNQVEVKPGERIDDTIGGVINDHEASGDCP